MEDIADQEACFFSVIGVAFARPDAHRDRESKPDLREQPAPADSAMAVHRRCKAGSLEYAACLDRRGAYD
jgi:hypothetical protein